MSTQRTIVLLFAMMAACAQVQAQDGAEGQIDAAMRDLKTDKNDYVVFSNPDGKEYVQYFMNATGVASQVPILFSRLQSVELHNNAYKDGACTLKSPEVDQSKYDVQVNLPATSVDTLVSYLKASGSNYEDTFCNAKDVFGNYVGYTRSLFIQVTPSNGRWDSVVRSQFRNTFGFEPESFIVRLGKFDLPAEPSNNAVAEL